MASGIMEGATLSSGWLRRGRLKGLFGAGAFWLTLGCSSGSSGSLARPNYCQDVRAIVLEKCVRCHSDPPQNEAPFPLTTYEAFDGSYPGFPDVQIAERARDAVASGLMPFTGLELDPKVEALEASEKETLLLWFDSGRPRGQCEE